MMTWIALALGIAAAGVAAGAAGLSGFARWQGDEHIILETDKAGGIKVSGHGGRTELTFTIPLTNTGPQNGMVMELWGRPEYPGEVLEKVAITPRFRVLRDKPRSDWYWEAVIVEKNKSYTVEGSVIFNGVTGPDQLAKQIPRLKLGLYLKTVGRREIRYRFYEKEIDIAGLVGEEQV